MPLKVDHVKLPGSTKSDPRQCSGSGLRAILIDLVLQDEQCEREADE